MELREYSGVIHLHSDYSDGHLGVEEIIRLSLEAGLDYLFLTDHDTLAARRDGWDGWYTLDDGRIRRLERGAEAGRRLLLLVGDEVTPDRNHYLALGYEGPEELFKLAPQRVIDRVAAAGGVGVIAHPDHRGNERFGIGCYAWDDWSVRGFDLVDLWDLMTDWQDHLRGLASALRAVISPVWVLKGPKRRSLRRWDERLRAGPAPVVGCNDNHGRPYNLLLFTLTLLPYPLALRTIHTHVLCEPLEELDWRRAEAALLEALVAGRSFIAQDYWWDARGLSCWAENPTGGRLDLGGTASFEDGPWTLRLELPAAARVDLVGDGELLLRRRTRCVTFTVVQPGAYRFEVWRRRFGVPKPWVFTNALRLVPRDKMQ
ncbi:MAG: hypothetical protein GF403_08410 [Candidatus Coatesbacteria bacterium]|nr:hypothetical protein [Candidatus Coatesbacteria bacterium]